MLARSLLVVGFAALAACSSNSKAKPSPMPMGYAYDPDAPKPDPSAAPGESLDEVLAVVEGRPITRRRLIRESGGRQPGMEEDAFERQLRQRLKGRVVEELFVREAQRIGIQVAESRLDEAVAAQVDRMVEDATKTTGRPVRFEEILADRGITEEEFRESIRRRGFYELYMLRVLEGLGPTRPQVGMKVSPAEIRRIYRLHPGEFDVKQGVKFAGFQVKFEKFLVGDATVEQAETAMRAEAGSLAQALSSGATPEQVALQRGLSREKGDWIKPNDFVTSDNELLPQILGADAAAWLFTPGRRVGESQVFEAERPEGPLVVVVAEVQEARRREWREVSEEIVKAVRLAREKRVEAQILLELVSQRSTVWPQEVADEVVSEARTLLERLDKDPVLGSARFQ